MRHFCKLLSCALFCCMVPSPTLAASSIIPPAWHAHTFLQVYGRNGSPTHGYFPDQIRHAYSLDQVVQRGSGQTIAIIDAFHDPLAGANLATFSETFHLKAMNGTPGRSACTVRMGPHPCLEVKTSSHKSDPGWNMETDLDLQWAHATAPEADIALIEAGDSSLRSLLNAVSAGESYSSILSLSWGGTEFAAEEQTGHLHTAGVTYVAASGDSGHGPSFPAALSSVMGVGGTTLHTGAQGKVVGEAGWAGSGGGSSKYVPLPPFQQGLSIHPAKRAIPDVALNADPATGYAVYSSQNWLVVGGTSASTPQWAGMLALAAEATGHVPTLADLYQAARAPGTFSDIHQGKNGRCKVACQASAGYDMVTGLGTPVVPKLFGALK